MDYYLVSVFENQGLTVVQKMCEQGKQKLALRNDTLRGAIQQHENAVISSKVEIWHAYHREGGGVTFFSCFCERFRSHPRPFPSAFWTKAPAILGLPKEPENCFLEDQYGVFDRVLEFFLTCRTAFHV